jgi:drug/metabolite transporter (DMT)-like permease
VAALLALSSSLLWGTGDFLGGSNARRWGVLRVLAWSQLATLLLMWSAVAVGVAAFGLELPARTLVIGAAGGAAGVIALAAFYRALAIGPMAIVPPIAAMGVVLPVAVGLATGRPPTAGAILGIVVAVVGVVLASAGTTPADSRGVRARIAPSTLALCLVAATGFALIFVALDAAAGDDPATAFVATAGVRLGSCATILVAILATRTRVWHEVRPRHALGFGAIGVFDTSANLLFATAAALGRLEVVAVLGSLYPAVTSALAHVVLGERLGRVQLLGVVLALAGVVLLAGH